jgi:hypothetical protein
MSETLYTFMETPIGRLLLAGDGQRLSLIGFPRGKGLVTPRPHWRRDDDAFGRVKEQLQEYFDGTRREFDLPLDLRGTGFQLTVWCELARIPYGETISYGELGGRGGERGQPDPHRHPLPPRHRRERQPDRVRRRHRDQEVASRAGASRPDRQAAPAALIAGRDTAPMRPEGTGSRPFTPPLIRPSGTFSP